MLTLKEFQKLQKAVESAKAEAERSSGALEQLKSQLKKDHNCSSLQEAKKKLEGLITKQKSLQSKYDKAMTSFKEKWDEK